MFAVIGDPVQHSLSPTLHNAAFAALGLDAVYVALTVRPGHVASAVAGMRDLGLGGLSVTMPYKTAIAGAVDEVSDDVRKLDAANTVVRLPDGRLRGESTDGYGFLDALTAAGVNVAGTRCVVFGAGGAGRSVILALARAGASSIGVVNRNDERAEAAVALAGGVGRRTSAEAVTDADIIVNATPFGMGLVDGGLVFDPQRLAPGQVVNDLVYHPLDTPLLIAARSVGATTVDGLGMLLYQAGRQCSLWTGAPPPIDAMRSALVAELALRHDA